MRTKVASFSIIFLALASSAAAEMRACSYNERNMCDSGAQVFVTTPTLTFDVIMGAFSDVSDYRTSPWEVFTDLDGRVERLSEDAEERIELGKKAAEYCKKEVFGCE